MSLRARRPRPPGCERDARRAHRRRRLGRWPPQEPRPQEPDATGDRYGRKRLYLIGLAIFTVFSAACGLARTDTELIVHRALQGAGAAIMAPLSLSILVDAYPPERRTAAIGIWASAAGLGFAAGPIVGGLLIALFDWSAVFFVNVPIAAVGFAVVLQRRTIGRGWSVCAAMLICHGLLAARARWRARVVAYGRVTSEPTTLTPPQAGGSEGTKVKSGARAWSRAALIHRAFAIDVLACPQCGGRLRLIATLHDPVVIGKLLAPLGMARSGPSPAAPPESRGVAP